VDKGFFFFCPGSMAHLLFGALICHFSVPTKVVASWDSLETPCFAGVAKPETGPKYLKPEVAQVYFLPPNLQGETTDSLYRRWLTRKAKYIIAQDRQRKRACARGATEQQYKESIHQTVTVGGLYDPFTGEKLQWGLICKWDDLRVKNIDEAAFRKYALVPTVDHIDPYADEIKFEICAWYINRSKNNLTADDYVALCEKIVSHTTSAITSSHPGDIDKSPQLYFLPSFLNGIISEARYRRWLNRKASHLYHNDVRQKRPCALNSSARQYKALIHKAILDNGLFDPFTGELLRWELLDTWDDSSDKNPGRDVIEKFSLLPTVDHIDPGGTTPGFEICSWLVNRCKCDMTPDEFISLCKKIIAFRLKREN
jgi:hypothetical protein